MSTHRLTWRGAKTDLTLADTALSDVLDPPAGAVTLLKDDASEADAHTGWQLHAYFEEAPDLRKIETALAAMGAALPAPKAEILEDRDWVAHALEGLGVVRAGPFVLYGSHDEAKARALPGHKIRIEANRAFGTGHHPTTEGCLAMLGHIEPLAPERVLDLGTGSGVLSIAARRLWPHADLLATDIDAPSVAIAEANAEENGAQGIRVAVADGVDAGVEAGGPYGLVLANILAEPLIALAPGIVSVLAPEGRVILAGLLARQEAAVTAAFAAQGLVVQDRLGDAWPILLLSRHAAS